MKWLAAVLMIVNVVVFLGVSDRQIESSYQQNEFKPDVNRESMLLLKEVSPTDQSDTNPLILADGESPTLITAPDIGSEPDKSSEIDGAVTPNTGNDLTSQTDVNGPVSVDGMVLEGSEISVASLDLNTAPGQFSCYRVGPFKDQSAWGSARQWVTDQGLEFKPVRSESRELRAVRVYIGPFASITAAQQDVDMLDQKELDYFVYLRDNGEARISLGYFTQEELAAKFVNYLSTQNIEAKSQPEYRTLGPFDWMDIKVVSTSRWDLLERDWDDDTVKISERNCGFE
ncbi:MAG: hypothetical protein ACR2QW_07530 [bacterium]